MTRTLLLWDRLVVIVVAVALAVLGLLGIAWYFRTWPYPPRRVDLGRADSLVSKPWSNWALLGVGIVLLLVGVAWLLAHLRSARVKRLTLRESSASQVLDVDGEGVVSAAASALGDTTGVRSARGHLVRDRGQLVASLVATVEPDVALSAVSAKADQVSAMLRTALDRPDVHCRVELKVAHRLSHGDSGEPRVA